MARPNPIRSIMEQPLPSITYQRRKLFRPTYADINYAYNIINRHVFNNCLRRPDLTQRTIKKAWGLCSWLDYEQSTGSWCTIELMDKWFCPQWFMNTLAHEMVHQYQWDVNSRKRMREGKEPIISHGPSFFEFREKLAFFDLDGTIITTKSGKKFPLDNVDWNWTFPNTKEKIKKIIQKKLKLFL